MPDVVAVATLSPVPGKTEELVCALTALVEQVSASEEGCLLYPLHRHQDGQRLVMVEKYTGAEAVQAHRASDHFRAAGAAMSGLLASPPEVLRLEPVPLGDPAKGMV